MVEGRDMMKLFKLAGVMEKSDIIVQNVEKVEAEVAGKVVGKDLGHDGVAKAEPEVEQRLDLIGGSLEPKELR